MIKIYTDGTLSTEEIMSRDGEGFDASAIVRDIIANVRKNGDAALREYCEKFDGGAPESLVVSAEEIDDAFTKVPAELIEAMTEARDNIRAFHEKQVRNGFIMGEREGVVLGQKVTPIERVGLYVPGGTASYPSTVLMDAVPAKIAGCSEIVITTPAKNGVVSPAILVAARLAGVDKIYKIGGAGAVAALAYGTETVGRVDKIVGPGNVFVAEAKRQVFGVVGIDMVAGPSEILIIADGKANPKYVAADMLSQAEHDKLASAVLVTDSRELAEKVSAELERQIPMLPRAEIARVSIDGASKIIVRENLSDVIDTANEIAPEHLEVCVDSPFDLLPKIKNAGSIFLGRNCPEALGDYFAGPNHTLPTSGTARFSSPLSVDDFTKKSSFIYYTKDALSEVAYKIDCFAKHEGLHAHAKSATIRLEGDDIK